MLYLNCLHSSPLHWRTTCIFRPHQRPQTRGRESSFYWLNFTLILMQWLELTLFGEASDDDDDDDDHAVHSWFSWFGSGRLEQSRVSLWKELLTAAGRRKQRCTSPQILLQDEVSVLDAGLRSATNSQRKMVYPLPSFISHHLFRVTVILESSVGEWNGK